jgi:hypothetical protein
MRGDSLRDFYAKALALVGLGTLASVGALVDYWPGQVDIPRVAGVTTRALLPSLPRAADLPLVARVTPARTPLAPRAVPAVIAVSTDIAQMLDRWDVLDVGALGTAPQLATVPPPTDYDVMPIAEMDLAVNAVRLASPPVAMVALEDRPVNYPQVSAPAPAAASADGITGMFRKTGSSLAAVGAKTGSTIIGAFRFVGGAFRKIL